MIAFATWVLPNTQSIFDKWKKVFTGMVFLYPLAAIYYGGLKLLSFTILGAGNGVKSESTTNGTFSTVCG